MALNRSGVMLNAGFRSSTEYPLLLSTCIYKKLNFDLIIAVKIWILSYFDY